MATDTTGLSSCAGGSTPNASTIGSELQITGNVTSPGKIRLDGQVQGDIQCASLILGENSLLEGNAVAEEVVVGGRFIGSIRAVHLTLLASAQVEGDLLSQSLAIVQGACFNGKSHPSDAPLSLQHCRVGHAAQQPLRSNDKRARTKATSFPDRDKTSDLGDLDVA